MADCDPPSPHARFLSRILPSDPLTTRLGVATLVSAVGNGMFITVSALFFTRAVGLSTQQVSVGLTVAGACAVVVGIRLGRAADRWGSHRLLAALMIAEAAGTATYVAVRTFFGFLSVMAALHASAQRCQACCTSTASQTSTPRRAPTTAHWTGWD